MSLANASDPSVPYVDRKRRAWVLSLLVPALVGLGPLLRAAFVYGAWFCMRTPLAWAGQLAIVMKTGMVGGSCLNLGHEPGHKKSRLERRLAKIVLAPTFYGHFDDAPQLPNGYFGMFTVAYFPPLWFALMDGRLVAAVHSDPARINFHPRRRAALMRRHGLVDFPARAA
jgi:hypothetical protein